jgi:hypothetical protein
MLCKVSIKTPGLALDNDESNQCVSGTNVRRVPKRRKGRAAVKYIALVP